MYDLVIKFTSLVRARGTSFPNDCFWRNSDSENCLIVTDLKTIIHQETTIQPIRSNTVVSQEGQ